MELNPALLTDPKSLFFYEMYMGVGGMLSQDFYLELKKYFLNHPDQFYATSPEYKYTLLCKFSMFLHDRQGNAYFTPSEEEKLFPPIVVDELISYCTPTNDVKNLATLTRIGPLLLSKVNRIMWLDLIFGCILKSPSLLSHPKFMEIAQEKLLESCETYPKARHYYNILFPPRNKRMGDDVITERTKYLRLEA